MKLRLFILLLFGVGFVVSGCRGRDGESAPAAQPPSQPVSTTAPTVTLTWPLNGARVRVGQAFTVHTTATDPSGIARVGYSVDGQAGAPVEGSAQPIFSASFPVTLQTKGVHTISVVAVNRGGTKSAPAILRVVGVSALNDAPAADDPPTPVPQLPSSAKPPAAQPSDNEPPPPPPPSGANVSFVANPTSIQTGECSTLRWDVDGVQEIYFEGAGVTGHEERPLCDLFATTTFVLHVVFQDGSASDYTASVHVTSNGSSGGGEGQQGDAPPAPTNCRANEVTAHHVLVQWDAAGTAGGFNLYLTRTQRVASAGANARAASVDNLNAATRFHIEVRAFNAFGESPVDGCAVEVTTAAESGNNGGQDRPDLVIESVQVTPVNQSGEVDIVLGVRNNGAVAVQSPFTIRWYPHGRSDEVGCSMDFPRIGANSRLGNRCPAHYTYRERGEMHWRAVVDADNDVAEANEGNNVQNGTVTISSGGGGNPVPPAPTHCTAEPSGLHQIRIRWEFSGQADGFHIYQGGGGNRTLEKTIQNSASRIGYVEDLTPGVQYHLEVVAFNSAGESPACALDYTPVQ